MKKTFAGACLLVLSATTVVPSSFAGGWAYEPRIHVIEDLSEVRQRGLRGLGDLDGRVRGELDVLQATAKQRKSDAALFVKSKKFINPILNSIMQILESDRAGTAKIRYAAGYLTELLSIHYVYDLEDKTRYALLQEQKESLERSLRALDEEEVTPYTAKEVSDAIDALSKENVDEKIINFLSDYYVAKFGYYDAYGFRIGAGVILGAEVGLSVGKSQTMTGERYFSLFPNASAFLGVGPSVFLDHYKGKAKATHGDSYYSSEKPLLVLDTFLAGKSVSHDRDGNDDGVVLTETGICPARMIPTGVMKAVRLFRIPGRDYKYLRQKLGLTPETLREVQNQSGNAG